MAGPAPGAEDEGAARRTDADASARARQTGNAVSGAENDRAALVALYNATDGPNWSHNTNWLSDLPISKWDGVPRFPT